MNIVPAIGNNFLLQNSIPVWACRELITQLALGALQWLSVEGAKTVKCEAVHLPQTHWIRWIDDAIEALGNMTDVAVLNKDMSDSNFILGMSDYLSGMINDIWSSHYMLLIIFCHIPTRRSFWKGFLKICMKLRNGWLRMSLGFFHKDFLLAKVSGLILRRICWLSMVPHMFLQAMGKLRVLHKGIEPSEDAFLEEKIKTGRQAGKSDDNDPELHSYIFDRREDAIMREVKNFLSLSENRDKKVAIVFGAHHCFKRFKDCDVQRPHHWREQDLQAHDWACSQSG